MTQERTRRRYRESGARLDGVLPAVRVTEAELQWTQDQARLTGQSLSDYVRAAVFTRNQVVAESDREHWLRRMVAVTVEDQWGMTLTAEDLSVVRASFNAAVQSQTGQTADDVLNSRDNGKITGNEDPTAEGVVDGEQMGTAADKAA